MIDHIEVIVVIAIVVIVLTGLFALIWLDAPRVARRGLRRVPLPIGTIEFGRKVTIRGWARAHSTLTENLHGDACIYARIAILHFFRRKGTDGNYSEGWRPVVDEVRGDSFAIVDDSGQALIKTIGSLCLLDEQWKDIDWENLPPREADFLSRHESFITRGNPAKIRQSVIREGDEISVFGIASAGGEGADKVFAAAKGKILAIGSQPLIKNEDKEIHFPQKKSNI